MALAAGRRLYGYKIASLLLAALFCTYLRVSLLVLYPVVVIICFYIFNWKLDRNAIYILLMIFAFWLFSFRNNFYLKYNLVSFYYFIPFILLAFASPPKSMHPDDKKIDYFKIFLISLTAIAFINDVAGLIQYARKPNDDSFVGIYGIFTVSQNGLTVLNAILFFYYLVSFFANKKFTFLLLSLFFFTCSVLGFYGAGMMVLIGALLLTFLKIRRRNILQLTAIVLFTLSCAIILMKTISPYTYDYNKAIVKRFLNPPANDVPRKLIIFKNYFNGYSSNIADLLFGSGPGTFNSRTAFMVGSPTYFIVDLIKSEAKPHYFINYAYTLWNPSNTGPYDGFMNQPFTSILALLGEYGLILTALLLYVLFRKFKMVSKKFITNAQRPGLQVEANMYKFCTYYLFLLIIIDNYIEYPEVTGLLLIIIILSRQQLSRYLIGEHDSKY